jgi:hydrogenase maturation protease
MTRCLVIGIGSPFGGDQIGWEVVDALSGRKLLGEGTEYLKLDRPGSQLFNVLNTTERVVLIDAMKASTNADMLSLTPDELLVNDCLVSSHGFGVAEALALARAIHGLPSRLDIIGVSLQANIESVLDKVAAIVANDQDTSPLL